MENLAILNTRQKKSLLRKVSSQWACDFKTDLVLLQSRKKKIYLVNKEIRRLDDSALRIDKMGMYFGEIMKDGDIRLSIEGSQMVGPCAEKNVVELDDDEARQWFKGNDVEKQGIKEEGFAIIKSNNDFMGCGKIKDSRIINYVPKTRRILAD